MTLEEIKEFMSDIYALKYIIRYNNTPKIQNESVAEHSFFVASIILKLYEEYDFDLTKALIMSITHDYVEIYISDVPRNVKDRFPALNESLNIVESQAWRTFFPQFEKLIEEFEDKKTKEAKIVKLADSLSILQYTKTEVKLGNEGYMKLIYDTVQPQVKEDLKEIEEFRRKEKLNDKSFNGFY